ncbi:hypothetical protein [Chryseobacterium indoltheticum]
MTNETESIPKVIILDEDFNVKILGDLVRNSGTNCY